MEFNLTKNNAKLAEQYCNFEDVLRSTTVELIKRDYDVDLINYQWSFNQNSAQIKAISDHPLTVATLTRLNQYTQNDIFDGIGENFTFQAFANLKHNQNVNHLNNFDLDDYNVLTLSTTPINFKLSQ